MSCSVDLEHLQELPISTLYSIFFWQNHKFSSPTTWYMHLVFCQLGKEEPPRAYPSARGESAHQPSFPPSRARFSLPRAPSRPRQTPDRAISPARAISSAILLAPPLPLPEDREASSRRRSRVKPPRAAVKPPRAAMKIDPQPP